MPSPIAEAPNVAAVLRSRGAPLSRLLLLLPMAAAGILAWRHRWVHEDAFIGYRIVHNLMVSHVPLFNLSQRVEGYTDPLWMLVQAVVAAVVGPFFRKGPPFEWLSVGLGISFTLLGMFAAGLGAQWLWGELMPEDRITVPAGLVVLIGIAAFWDFTTSGLETGLGFLWLGAAFWGLTRALRTGRDHLGPQVWPALWLSLGSLVRPDLEIYSLLFLAVQALRLRRWAHRCAAVALGLAAPLAYQIFRMGYFAAIVPNTAIAKEAGLTNWAGGWGYLKDFVGVYLLWIPLLGLVVPIGWATSKLWRGRRLDLGCVLLVPCLGALLHVLYVVRVGGDYMHGRMLLPALFAFLSPVAAIPWRSGRWLLPALGVWAVISAARFREPDVWIDARGVMVQKWSGKPHPVTLEDYENFDLVPDGWNLRKEAAEAMQARAAGDPLGRFDYERGKPEVAVKLQPWIRAPVAAVRAAMGLGGYAAGPDVEMLDLLSLTDPIAARVRLEKRGFPGHEKQFGREWEWARAVDAESDDRIPQSLSREKVAAARAALQCGLFVELEAAITGPLTASRFFRNILASVRLTRFRFNADPIAAEAKLCPRASGS
ncbi:MAG: hypothetical protein ACYDCL_21560 [Myxococcales bacterium]